MRSSEANGHADLRARPPSSLLRQRAAAFNADVRFTAGHDLDSLWFEPTSAGLRVTLGTRFRSGIVAPGSVLTDPGVHNTTVIRHDPVQAVRQLKQQPGADIVQYGFGFGLEYPVVPHESWVPATEWSRN
jgi:hypothetical protein